MRMNLTGPAPPWRDAERFRKAVLQVMRGRQVARFRLNPNPIQHSMLTRVAVCALALNAGWSRIATSQSSDKGCIWPAPPVRCSSWLITEAGLAVRLTDLQPGDERVLVGYALGFMKNNTRTAIGGEIFGGVEGEGRGGAALRFRKWLTPRTGLDLGAGIHLFGDASSQSVALGSPTFTVRFTYADLIAAHARVDVLQLQCNNGCTPDVTNPNGTSTRLYLGAETGSKPGVLAMVLTGIVVGIAAASYGS